MSRVSVRSATQPDIRVVRSYPQRAPADRREQPPLAHRIRKHVRQTNYAASKAGLIGLTKSLARELASRNITVNAVAPGFVITDMTAGLSDQVKDTIHSKIPLGRTGTPEEIAAAVEFLASPEAAYITGQVLCVDGGIAM